MAHHLHIVNLAGARTGFARWLRRTSSAAALLMAASIGDAGRLGARMRLPATKRSVLTRATSGPRAGRPSTPLRMQSDASI